MTVQGGELRRLPECYSQDEPHVFTTVRWDPVLLGCAENTAASCNCPCPFYMLEHHWTRLQIAKWNTSLVRSSAAELLQVLLSAVRQWLANHPGEDPESLRVKHRVYTSGRTVTEISTISRIPISRLFPDHLRDPEERPEEVDWTVCLDQQPIETGAKTKYKTGDRLFYERARASAGIKTFSESREVLLYNHDEEVMDASISTPYFFRNAGWITPKADSGGQQGTTRRWTLERGMCSEGDIKIHELREGEVVYMSNAVRGYFRARYFVHSSAINGKHLC